MLNVEQNLKMLLGSNAEIGKLITFECVLLKPPFKGVVDICDINHVQGYKVFVFNNKCSEFDYNKNINRKVVISGNIVPVGNTTLFGVVLISIAAVSNESKNTPSNEEVKYNDLVSNIETMIDDITAVITSSSQVSLGKIFKKNIDLTEQLNMAIEQSTAARDSIVLSCIVKKLQALIK